MEKGRTFETIVGTLVLIVAGLFFNYVYHKSSWQNIDGYYLIAKFDHADGMNEGSEVKISGLRVGKVVDVHVDPKSFLAIVRFSVDNAIQLPADTSAKISSDGLLGGKYLELIPGEEDDKLKPNEEISYTTGAVSLESLIGKFMFSKDDNRKDSEKSKGDD